MAAVMMVAEYVLVLAAVLADLWSGLRKARRRGEARRSEALRRTVSKLGQYYNAMFALTVVDLMQMGVFAAVTVGLGFRAGFCFSAGATDLVFSASLPAAAKTWMIIPLGIAAFVVFYAVFYFAITKYDLKTPGREDEDEEAEKKVVLANNNYTEVASAVLAAVGGKENVKDVGYCATRLRFEVKDNAKVDEKAVFSGDSAVFGNVDKAAVPTGENITIMRRCSRCGNIAAVFNGDFGDHGAVESVNECNSVNID